MRGRESQGSGSWRTESAEGSGAALRNIQEAPLASALQVKAATNFGSHFHPDLGDGRPICQGIATSSKLGWCFAGIRKRWEAGGCGKRRDTWAETSHWWKKSTSSVGSALSTILRTACPSISRQPRHNPLYQRHHERGRFTARVEFTTPRVVKLSELQENRAKVRISHKTLASPLYELVQVFNVTLSTFFILFFAKDARRGFFSYG